MNKNVSTSFNCLNKIIKFKVLNKFTYNTECVFAINSSVLNQTTHDINISNPHIKKAHR